MKNFLAIVRAGFGLLKRSPGQVALYLALSFVAQTLIPVVFVPSLLAKVTNSVPARPSGSAPELAKSGSIARPSATRSDPSAGSSQADGQENAEPRPSIVAPYLEWLVLVFALIPLSVWFRLAQNDLDSSMEFELRQKIFANVLRQPPEFFSPYKPGMLASIVTQMVTQAQQAYRSLTLEPIMQFVTLACASYLIIRDLQKMSGSIVWLTVFAILLVGFFTVYIVQKKGAGPATACQEDIKQKFLEVSGQATQTMGAPQDIQMMNAEGQFAERYAAANKALYASKRRQLLTFEGINSLLGLPTQLILGVLFGFVVYAVSSGKPGVDPGTIVKLSFLVPRLMDPFRTFAALGLTASSSWPAVEMVTRLSEQPSRISDAPGAKDVDRVEPTLVARNLSFQYQADSAKVFDNVSFEVPPGKITGFVARFGQGKTTFFRLAVRLYDPQQGQILLGGHATTSLTLPSLRRQISLMSQSPAFFHLTVREHFRIAKPDATDAEIRRVAEKTGLWPILVEKYGSNPLDAPFAAGAELSGGQKRKFSLTCALLRDSVFVFLDEPSTGLSGDELEDLVATIRSSCAGKTVMVVDHILPAFISPLCDHVMVLDRGQIVQQGTPEQLRAEDGIFAELYEAQLPQSNLAAL